MDGYMDARFSNESDKADPTEKLPDLEDLNIKETKGMSIDDFDLLKIIG